ncbi:hypothetical protein Tco_0906467 [Tanacetum coccineum]|uniref:Uncharacterized protein n=1 Tax=Tanacetum coccineum TaxID=301880 RepID=A0ABQ5CJ96_9ASTR
MTRAPLKRSSSLSGVTNKKHRSIIEAEVVMCTNSGFYPEGSEDFNRILRCFDQGFGRLVVFRSENLEVGRAYVGGCGGCSAYSVLYQSNLNAQNWKHVNQEQIKSDGFGGSRLKCKISEALRNGKVGTLYDGILCLNGRSGYHVGDKRDAHGFRLRKGCNVFGKRGNLNPSLSKEPIEDHSTVKLNWLKAKPYPISQYSIELQERSLVTWEREDQFQEENIPQRLHQE